MPKIAINATVLTPQSGGILVYIQNLIDQLLKIQDGPDFRFFFSNRFLESFTHFRQSNHVIGLTLSGESPRKRILSDPWVWPHVIRKYGIDVFHSPISYLPLGVKIPSVVTIHDLRSFHFPENYSRLRGTFLRQMIRRTEKMAAKIIAISDYTKNDLMETLRVPAERIVRIYEGFDPTPFQIDYSAEQIRHIRQKYQIPEKFILSVGHLEPRKNFVRLIKAFHQVVEQEKISHKLVIVGKENQRFHRFYDIMHQLKLTHKILFTGFVASDHLPALYQLAEVFVLPTLFEGFGFPPLESMAAGTPVISSNVTSLPEICGDAALYFDPYDENCMSAKILEILTDSELKMNLIRKGLQNINRFNWERCAVETVKVYQEIGGSA